MKETHFGMKTKSAVHATKNPHSKSVRFIIGLDGYRINILRKAEKSSYFVLQHHNHNGFAMYFVLMDCPIGTKQKFLQVFRITHLKTCLNNEGPIFFQKALDVICKVLD